MKAVGLLVLLITLPFSLFGIIFSMAIYSFHPMIAIINFILSLYWPYVIVWQTYFSGDRFAIFLWPTFTGALLFNASFVMHAFASIPLIFAVASFCAAAFILIGSIYFKIQRTKA